MPLILQKEIEKLKVMLSSLSALVEENVYMSAKAVENRDSNIAEGVIESDSKVDKIEVEIEEECLKVLALYQPVAVDLRFIVAILKINNDLERISDLAGNIAEKAIFLSNQPKINIPFDLPKMAKNVQQMLKYSIDSLLNIDIKTAREVCLIDNEVDEINRKMYENLQEKINNHPEQFGCMLHYIIVCRNLERIADHATNIAEDVIYMIEGEIVRHKTGY